MGSKSILIKIINYHTSAVDAVASKNVFTENKLAAMRTEQAFTHQQIKGEVTESRYALLYQTIPEISTIHTVSEVIRNSLLEAVVPPFARYLSSQLNALDQLEDASTARLERAFVEHLDCCSYRLDAWKTGIITNELNYMRGNFPGVDDGQRRTGIYLGAFGWLENVQPDKNKVVKVKEIPGELKDDFNAGNNKVFLSDASNEGYIHAPSLNQGVTAAVLRNGFISHGKPDGNNVLAVNLTSERVRLALSVIEGMQGGQSLAALLGYHFERSLHDRNDLKTKGIDSYIYPLRKKFPLAADKLKETKVKNNTDASVDPETVPITAIEARNVIHGVNLANHVKSQTGANKNYPFGLPLAHPDAVINKAITDAVTDAVNDIIDIADAVADLGIAESVHHVVMGNYDRAAGVLETYSKGNYPQEPDVIRTPRSGATLTHRVAIPFTYVASGVAGSSPRAISEPSVNNWLVKILPAMNKIICECSYISRADSSVKTVQVSMQNLGLEPIDLLYAIHALDAQALNELDDRLLFHLNTTTDPVIDKNITFNYTVELADSTMFPVFQVMSLIKSLRALLIESVPLAPTDLALPNEASKKDMPAPELPVKRVEDLKTSLNKVLTDANAILTYLNGLPASATATPADLDSIRNKADDTINQFAKFLLDLGRHGIQQTGIGSIYTERQQWFISLKKKVQEVIDRWQKKLDDYAILNALPVTPERLQEMERLVSSTTTPADTITAAAVQAKKDAFDSELVELKKIINKNYSKVADLIQDIVALDTTAFDIVKIDITDELRKIPLFVYDLQVRSKALLTDLQKKRLPAVDAILTALPALKPEDQVKQIEAVARIILGDDFKMVPRYALPPAQQAEIANSWNATDKLLKYQEVDKARTNAREDWLHGIARVHEKMKHLENTMLLRDAFDMTEDDLMIHPVQLPFKADKYTWLAMPFKDAKEDIDMDNDKEEDRELEETNTLLYTAFTNTAEPAPTEICGMRVDEWTELIPAKKETTGITFQYDRPNSEAPQTILLVAPTKLTGNWQWNDLVDALSYTLDAAKSRGVQPSQIDATGFASFLPAVLGAESLLPFSIVLDNKVHQMDEKFVRNFDN